MSLDPHQIFFAVIELPESERMAFLDTACGQDLALRREVDSLLVAHEPSKCDVDTPTLIQKVEDSQDETDIGDFVSNLPVTMSAGTRHAGEAIKGSEPGHGATPHQHLKETNGTPADVIAGRYTLMELLGEGGMGEVWIAQQHQPVKRRVALKLIKGGMDSRAVIARFEGERQALARMDHPNIARVLDGGLAENRRPFFVMELVEGQPLEKVCDEARLTIRQRLEIFISICEAVQHAHQKGLIHRDLKPGNILVSLRDDRYVPKVIDFGLAKATEGKLTDETMATIPGSVVGTLAYMSPEQAGSADNDIDTRSDIYSLGVILYELLTGLRPFDAKRLKQAGPAGAIRIIQQDEPPKPSSRLSNHASQIELANARKTEPQKLLSLLKGELDWVVMKCLEKSPERRYETANALARDIERYLADEPVEARPPSTRYRLEKFLQRNKGPVIAAGCILLALIGGMIGTGIGLVRAWKAEEVARTEAKKADEARKSESLRADGENRANLEAQKQQKIAEENAKEAKRQLAEGLIAQGDALKLASRGIDAYERYREAYHLFLELNEAPKIAEVALWQHSEQYLRPLLTTVRDGAWFYSLAIAPDNRTAVLAGQAGTLVIWDIVTGRELRTLRGHNELVKCIALSPDGQRALSGSIDKTLKIWDLTNGQELRTLVGHAGSVNCVALSPDGLTAVSGGYDGAIMEWDLSSGKVVRSFLEQTGQVTSVAYSPDGRNLFAATRSFDRETQKAQGKLQQWDLAQGQIVRTFGHQKQVIEHVAISADGQMAMAGMSDQTMLLWDLNTGEELRKFAGHSAQISNLTFSPDGRKVLSGSSDGGLKLWDLSTGKEQCIYLGHSQMVWSLGISPDGRFALSGSTDGILKLWDLADRQERRFLNGHVAPVRTIVIAADGRTALSGSWDNNIRHWDLDSGKDLHSIPQPTGGNGAAISSDGNFALFPNADFSLNLWDLVNGESLRRLAGHTKPIGCVAFSPDGRTALSASVDQTLKYWDLESGSELYTLKGVHPQVNGIAISPDGRTAVSAGSYEKGVKIWDLGSGELRHSLSGHEIGGEWSVSISRDRTLLSSGGDPILKLWNLDDGQELRPLTGHQEQVWGTAISTDGRLAFTGSHDSTLRIWDLTRGKELRTLPANQDMVSSLAIAEDGRMAMSGGMQGSLLLWDFFRASRTMELEDRLEEAQRNLQRDPDNAAALTTLGTWYSFRGMNAWGIELLVRAREQGAEIPTETLARDYWKLGQFAEAKREFEIALKQSEDLTHRRNLVQCLRSVERESEHYRRREVAAATPPLTEDDFKRISELPPNDQIAEIERELTNRNPKYHGRLTPTIVDDTIIGLVIPSAGVTDISPIHALNRLKSLEMKRQISNEPVSESLTNLTPLQGLPLIKLDLSGTNVSDLSPLQGLPLEELNLSGSKVTDLAPLKGMPLKRLNLLGNAVADLSPLAGMPLESLNVDRTDVRSLTPLQGMPLKCLTVAGTQVMAGLELEAIQLQQKGDLEGVAAVWRNAVENCAIQDMAAYEHLSLALRRNRDLQGAIRVLETCLKTVPIDVDPYRPIDPRPWGLREESVKGRDALLNAYATDGRWEDAIRIGIQEIEQFPENSWYWYQVVVLLAMTGEDARHRDHCLRMIEKFEKSSDINTIWATCTGCVLLQNRDERTRFAEQRLPGSLDEKRLDPDFIWISAFTRPLLALRLNDPTLGLRYNERALRPDLSREVGNTEVAEGSGNNSSPHQIECNRVLYLAYRSLARQQLGQLDEARADALEAAALNEHLVQDDDDSLYERLMARILIREGLLNTTISKKAKE